MDGVLVQRIAKGGSELSFKQINLLRLIHSYGQVTLTEISTELNITPSAVSQMVRNLEKYGYVKRRAYPHNRKKVSAILLQKGMEKLEKYDQFWVNQCQDKFQDEEALLLYALVQKLYVPKDQLRLQR
ncbi:hypothetical protein CN507_17785 [Bacillus cereus]|nr:hypothetical protein CN507_17785 [Bacillus cereus]